MTVFLLSIAGSGMLLSSAQAQFAENPRDLLLIFRQVADFAGQYDIEVDIGQASTYYNAAPGTSITINQTNMQQVSTYLGPAAENGTLNGLSFSVSGYVSAIGDGGSPSKPNGTLWMTDPRSDPSTPAQPWQRQDIYGQSAVCTQLSAIGYNAGQWGARVPADPATNSADIVIIPFQNEFAADGTLSSIGNLDGYFQGTIENTTPFAIFDEPAVSDFYELQPGRGNGTFLGYFSLDPNTGTLTYFSAPYPTPNLSVSNDGAGHVLISFATAANGTYTLHYTSGAGLNTPVSSWSTVSTNITGNGSVQTFTRPIGAAGTSTYYSVSVH